MPPCDDGRSASGLPLIDPHEEPRARATRILSGLLYSVLSELLLRGVRADEAARITVTAFCRTHRTRLVCHLVHYDSPAWEPVRSGAAPRPLTGTQRRIVGLLDRERPRTPKWIAGRLGKRGVDSYLRQLLRELCRQRVLRRDGGGYVLA